MKQLICPHCNKALEYPNAESMKFCPLCGGRLPQDERESEVDTNINSSSDNRDSSVQPQCPICCTAIDSSDEYKICADCGIAYHKECWDGYGGCIVADCPSMSPVCSAPISAEDDDVDTAEETRQDIASDTEDKPEEKKTWLSGSKQCPICCTDIDVSDEYKMCPDCGMVYHRECWEENKGCATYGCPSAGCLEPPPPVIDVNSLPASSSHDLITCPHCGTQHAAGVKFCWSCGNDISDVPVPAEQDGHSEEQEENYVKWVIIIVVLIVIWLIKNGKACS